MLNLFNVMIRPEVPRKKTNKRSIKNTS